jgi:hypothetical protein
MLGMIAGCGSITREVVLHSNETLATGMRAPDSVKAIYFSGLVDKRTDREIGFERVFNDKILSKIVATNSVDKWVNREIVFQLRQKGFSFLPLNASKEIRHVSISGVILRVLEIVRGEYSAEVCFIAQIAVDSTAVSEKKYRGEIKHIMDDVSSAQVFEGVLRSAMTQAVNQLVEDIETSWSKVPGDMQEEIAIDTVKKVAQRTVQTQNKVSLFQEELCPREGNKVVILQGSRQKLSIKNLLDSIRFDVIELHRQRQRENPILGQSICIGIVIEPDGMVSIVKEITPSGDDEFSRKVLDQIQALRFSRRTSDSVATHVLYSLNFGKQTTQQPDSESVAMGMRVISILLSLISLFLIPTMLRQ